MVPRKPSRVGAAALSAAMLAWGMSGCGLHPGRAKAQPQGDAAQGNAEKNGDYKSRIARALNGAFNELDGEETDEERELIRQSLDQNDEELARVLEGNSREAILAANQRLPEVVIEPSPLVPPGGEGAQPGPDPPAAEAEDSSASR